MNDETFVSTALDAPHRTGSGTADGVPIAGEEVLQRRLLGRRRRFLVDPKRQLRTSALVVGTALFLVVLLNLSLHSARTHSAAAVLATSPGTADIVEVQNRVESLLVVLASVFFLVAVFVMSIVETHKVAGAAVKLKLSMERLAGGDLTTRLSFRKGDRFSDLGSSFNCMVESLQGFALQESNELEELAEYAAAVSTPGEAAELAARLQAVADRRRRPASASEAGP